MNQAAPPENDSAQQVPDAAPEATITSDSPGNKISRRAWLRKAAKFAVGGAALLTGYATLIETRAFTVTEREIFIPGLPPAFDGFRLTQITDVHHSRLVPLMDVERVVELALQTKPDAFILTGDYSTKEKRYIEPCAEALGRLSAPEGVWAVLGNHDHYNSPTLTTVALRRARINVMDNINTTLVRGGDKLQLAGIDDWSWNAMDWARATRGLDKTRPTIMLSHQPRVLDLAEAEQVSLIISGHTHGGQIKLPFIGTPARFVEHDMRYAEGMFRRNNTQLFVSRGTGVIGIPIRFGVPPEIAVIKLRRAPESTEDSRS